MLARDRKIEIGAPCLFDEYDSDKQSWEKRPPAVDCSFHCESCGWNIDEQERRLADGEWVFDADGVRRLVFKNVREEKLIPV